MHPIMSVPNPRLRDVTDWMVKFANKGKTDMRVRRLVETLCAGLEPGDYASECFACYAWVDQNVRYMRDIHDVEFLKEPGVLLETLAGDCDDIATLLAAMFMASGNECVFSLVGFNGAPYPSHVFVCVKTADGLIPYDPVARYRTDAMSGAITSRINVAC